MQFISADGRLVGYVERLTDAPNITFKPCRHIPLNSIRRRILPGVPILGGFWRLDQEDPGHRQLLAQLAIAASVRMLAEAVGYCRERARADPAAIGPAPLAPSFARKGTGELKQTSDFGP